MINWIKNNKKIAVGALVAILVISAFFIYKYFNQETLQKVTVESQAEAETPQGVNEAALNAKIRLQQDQLNEAAQQIATLKDRQPETIIKTIAVEVPKVVEKERQASGADFAIVTNPTNPNEKVDLSQYNENQPVTLNQYNVHAYKDKIRQWDYAPKSIDDWKPREIGYSESRKISNDGKYLGIAVDHDFDDKKTTVKLRYTY